MSDLDDLRRFTEDDPEDESIDIDFENTPVLTESSSGDRLFLGMTAVERMFISIFLFMNITVLGIALLLATGRIG